MKSEREIYLNFQQAEELVNELRGIARDTRSVANDELQSALNQVDRAWDGENSQAFLRKGARLKGDVVSLAAKVDQIANAIERIAKNTYKAEMRAVRIAKTKSRRR